MRALKFLFVLLRRYKNTLLLVLIVSMTTMLISSVISIWCSRFYNLTLPGAGTIKTVGVEAYWDQDLENKTENIDWGTMLPGLQKNFTLYVRSVSNIMTTLTLNTSNLNPADISDYMTLTWDYRGKPVNPGEVIKVTLFFSVSNDNFFINYIIAKHITDFSIDINIIASE